MSKDIECKICGHKFKFNINNHYIAKENTKIVALGLTGEKIYDAFDCPNCGCQIIAQERKKKYLTYDIITNYTGDEDKSVKDDIKDSNNTDNTSDVDGEAKEYPECFGKYEDENELECGCCEYNVSCRIEEMKDKEKDDLTIFSP